MSLLITRGLGSFGDGSASALLTTQGLGDPGPATSPVCKAFRALSVNPFLTYSDIVFNNLPNISGPSADPSQYLITPLDSSQPVKATSVIVLGNRIRVFTTEHTNGGNYRLTIPSLGLVDQFNNVFDGLFTIDYVGVGAVPTALLARAVDARTIEVTFSEAVQEADATNPSNYSISPPLAVISVSKLTDIAYRVVTARQIRGQSYNVTVTGIRDLSGNPI